MPQTHERQETRLPTELDVRVDGRPRFTRWLGCLLVTVMVLGAAALIWYGIANDSTEVVAGDPPVIANIDPHVSPEVFKAPLGGIVVSDLSAIDPHESPEAFRRPAGP